MRHAVWFIVFAACAGPGPAPAPAPATPVAADCSQCPTATCPEVVCPKQTCPTCPEPPPPPPRPVAKDWQCLDLHRPKGVVSGFCFTLKTVCEERRKEAIDKRYGKPTQCMTQQIAYCVRRADPTSMSHQTICTRTAEGCETRRLEFIKHSPAISSSTECHPVLNNDTFETPREFDPYDFL